MRNFNTLKSFDRLKKVGVSEEQAREFVSLFEESVNASMENLATKSDLQLTDTGLSGKIEAIDASLKSEIQAIDLKLTTEMQNLRLEFKTDIAELRHEMTQQFSEQGKKFSTLETGQILMQRLFFGGTLLILLSIGALFLHH